jgi:outer membrane protein OmpA-like peptidoglycan-associated protein
LVPGPIAGWYTVDFATGSYAIDTPTPQTVVEQVIAFPQRNPATVATVIGSTDTVGSADNNMHLSHRRADAVRDASFTTARSR